MDFKKIINFIQPFEKMFEFHREFELKLFRMILFEILEYFDKTFHCEIRIISILKLPDFGSYKELNLIPLWKKNLEPILNKVYSQFIDPETAFQPTISDEDFVRAILKGSEDCQDISAFLWGIITTRKWCQAPIATRKMFALHCWINSLLILCQIQSHHCGSIFLLEKSLSFIDSGLNIGLELEGHLLMKSSEFLQKILIILLEKFTPLSLEKALEWRNLKQTVTCYYESPVSPAPIGYFPEPGSVENGLELNKFENDYFRKSNPLVIRNGMHDWPCRSIRQWNLSHLLRMMAFRLVPVEIGQKYTEENSDIELMPFHKFVQQFILQANGKMGCMAQYNLFDFCSELSKDICIPNFCTISDQDKECQLNINAWFGPSGTVEPLHHDSQHTFLCQIIGMSFVRIYSNKVPDECIYRYPKESPLYNTSKVDVENVDKTLYPNFDQISDQYVWDCNLIEGDMLFIPKNFWYYVKARTDSFSLKFWWQ